MVIIILLGRPGTYRTTDIEDSTKEGAPVQSKDKAAPSIAGEGQTTGKGKFGSKGGPTEGEALPVGDETLPWRQKKGKVVAKTQLTEQHEKIQETITKQQAQPWTQEKITLKKTAKVKKEVKKETLEEVSLKPTTTKEKEVPKDELEKVDLRHITEQQKETLKISKDQLSVDKVRHVEDKTVLQISEAEKTGLQQQAIAKDWRKKRVGAKQELEDSRILHLEETEAEKTVPWLKQIKHGKSLEDRKEAIKDVSTDQSLTKQHIEDTTLLRVTEKETEDTVQQGVAKDWRKPRKPSEKETSKEGPSEIKVTDQPEKPQQALQRAPKEEPIPWNKQEIKLKSTTKTKKEVVTEKMEDVQLKPVQKTDTRTIIEQRQLEDSKYIQVKEKANEQATEQVVTKDWRKPHKVEKPEQPTKLAQVEDTTLLHIDEREKQEVQEQTAVRDWRKIRKPSEKPEQQTKLEQKYVEDKTLLQIEETEKKEVQKQPSTKDWRKPRKLSDKPEEQITAEQQNVENKTILQVEEKEKEEVKDQLSTKSWRKPRKLSEKPEEQIKVEQEHVEDKSLLQIKETEKDEVPEQVSTKDWRKLRKPTEQQTKAQQKEVQDTTLLRIKETEKQEVKDEAIAVDWRKPRKPSEKPKEPLTQQQIDIKDTTMASTEKETAETKEVTEKHIKKPSEKLPQPKEEPVPWNKQEIKLKSTIKTKKETSTEKTEDVKLKPLDKPEKEVQPEQKQEDDTVLLRTKDKEDVIEHVETKQPIKPQKTAKDAEKPTEVKLVDLEGKGVVKPDEKMEEARREPKMPTEKETDKFPAQTKLTELKKPQQDLPQSALKEKEETIPWNKQEIKLKSTVKIKKEPAAENLEEVTLKPVKKTEVAPEERKPSEETKPIAPKEKEELTQQLTTKGWRKLQNQTEKIEQLEQPQFKDSVVTKEKVVQQETSKEKEKPLKSIEDVTQLPQPESEDLIITEEKVISIKTTEEKKKPRKPTEKVEQPTVKQDEIPWNKQEIKLKSTMKTKKDTVTEKIEEVKLKPVENAEKETVLEQQQTEDTTLTYIEKQEIEKPGEQPVIKDWRKPRKPTEKHEQPIETKQTQVEDTTVFEQQNLEDTRVHTEEQKEQPITKDWRKPRKPAEKTEQPSQTEQKRVDDTTVLEQQELEDKTLTHVTEKEKEQPTEQPDWRKPEKPIGKPEQLTKIEQKQAEDTITLEQQQLEKSTEKLTSKDWRKSRKSAKKPEEAAKTELQQIEDTTVSHTKETEKAEATEVKQQEVVVDWRKPQRPLNEQQQAQQKQPEIQPTSLEDVDEKHKKSTKPKEIGESEKQPEKVPVLPEQQPKKEEKQKPYAEKPKEHKTPETVKESEAPVPSISEDKKEPFTHVPSELVQKPVMEEEMFEKAKPEIKPSEEKLSKDEIPWTKEKIQLKKTVRHKKATEKEGIEDVVLKPLAPKKEEPEETTPVVATLEKPENVEEVHKVVEKVKVTRKTLKKPKEAEEQPEEKPETVVVEETITEVEDTVVLKVDEQPKSQKAREDVLDTNEKTEKVPWRRQRQLKTEETEQIEKIQLKPVKKTPQLEETDKAEVVQLKSVPQKEDQITQRDTVKHKGEKVMAQPLPESLPDGQSVELEKYTKPEEENNEIQEEHSAPAPWRKQPKPKLEEIPDQQPTLKIGKGKIPKEKEFLEEVSLKPIPRKSKEAPAEKPKTEPDLVPVKLEDTKIEQRDDEVFIKQTNVKLTKPEEESETLETTPDLKPADVLEEEVLPQQIMTVDIKSKKTIRKQQKGVHYDDDRPIPELEIISQKRSTQEAEKIPEEQVSETKIIQEEVVSTRSQKKRQVQKAKPKPPKFVQRLEPVAAEKNKPARLICKVEGSPFPEVAWYRNEVLLQPSENIQINVTEEAVTLEFGSVQPQDVAIYSCKAINPAGVASSTANLVILGRYLMLCVCSLLQLTIMRVFWRTTDNSKSFLLTHRKLSLVKLLLNV